MTLPSLNPSRKILTCPDFDGLESYNFCRTSTNFVEIIHLEKCIEVPRYWKGGVKILRPGDPLVRAEWRSNISEVGKFKFMKLGSS